MMFVCVINVTFHHGGFCVYKVEIDHLVQKINFVRSGGGAFGSTQRNDFLLNLLWLFEHLNHI